MSHAQLLRFSYDPSTDVLEVEGIKYAGCLFREFGWKSMLGAVLRINRREDGVVTVYKVEEGVKQCPTSAT